MHDPEAWSSIVADHHASGWWGDVTLSAIVRSRAQDAGDAVAFVGGGQRLTWANYDRQADAIADLLSSAAGIRPQDRIAVWLPDLPMTHAAYLGVERAGGVIVGIGARAGEAELRHLLAKTGAAVLMTLPRHRDVDTAAIVERVRDAGQPIRHLVVPRALDFSQGALLDGQPVGAGGAGERVPSRLAVGPDDLWLINSTSGTTGMPKCVMHNQNRWFAYHRLAVEAGALTADDVWLSAVPTPFGFGIWTAHVTPTTIGSPTVVVERFDAAEVLRLIEEHRVTVIACVSTQFIMLLNALDAVDADLSSLRIMFTGGEAVPVDRATRFEDRFGATVLQFFGSNETGALSRTTLMDSAEKRLTTAGQLIPSMHVRLFDQAGVDVTNSRRGIPAGRGPLACLGYYDDEEANRRLFTDDGWMLMGDVVEIDVEGYLKVVGRTADIIIRGGKNISAAQVEDAVGTHPAVAIVGAVGVADEVFGERVCAFVELTAGGTLTLPDLQDHLAARGVSKEFWPERLEIVDALPRASGGKVAKGELRRIAADLALSAVSR
jgi:acyl-CoA synthetase